MSNSVVATAASCHRRRVVVTGLGSVSPLGMTFSQTWQSLLSGKSGVTSLKEALQRQHLPEEVLERELQTAQTLPCQVAAPVSSDDHGQLSHDPRTPRFVQMALLAGKEALTNANLLDNNSNLNVHGERIGVCVGSGMSGVREIVQAAHTMDTRGIRKLSPHFVPKVLSNSAASRLSLQYNLKGPNHSVSTACAAGTHALGDAMRCIQYDNADIVLAGGAEACIDPLSMAGFCRLKALSTNFNHSPSESSRPFDKHRDGFVMGEGAAILVLEELQHAKARQATILAEVCGYGLTGDAHHITAPDPSGNGAQRAMQMALEQAAASSQITMEEMMARIGYVNAHATSTPMGDDIEARAIDRLFARTTAEDNNNKLYISSTKGATGHLLGAAGALEAAITVMTLVKQQMPPNGPIEPVVDEEESLFQHSGTHLLGNRPVHYCDTITTNGSNTLNYAISNSFGFGGTNASLVFGKYNDMED